jgi:hypothetical protein
MLAIHSAHPGLAGAGTAIYAGLVFACVAAYWSARRHTPGSVCWLALAALQAFFAADAWFGLRLAVAETGRQFFKHRGWYANRRPTQAVLSAGALLISVLITLWLIRQLRGRSKGCRLAISGTGLLTALFLLSAVSWHLIDKVLSLPAEPFTLGLLIRLAACGLTAMGVWQEIASGRN